MISSNVTFLYYEDYDKAITFFEEVLNLKLIMDQHFARVYEVTKSSFLGMVKKETRIQTNDTLYSFTVDDVDLYFKLYSSKDVHYLSKMNHFKDIPLKSFFFEDFEGHKFEIQEFLKKEDKELF